MRAAMKAGGGKQGFSLFELLIAMLLLTMVSVMIYSVLKVGIRFSAQGEKRIVAMERKYGLLNLLQRQITGAVYDTRKRRLLITADGDMFKLVTRAPFTYPDVGVVLAVYRYDDADGTIYYLEKRDYYNTDYGDDYVPDFADMTVLARGENDFSITYDETMGPEVVLAYRGEEYVLVPKCADEQSLRLLGSEE